MIVRMFTKKILHYLVYKYHSVSSKNDSKTKQA